MNVSPFQDTNLMITSMYVYETYLLYKAPSSHKQTKLCLKTLL